MSYGDKPVEKAALWLIQRMRDTTADHPDDCTCLGCRALAKDMEAITEVCDRMKELGQLWDEIDGRDSTAEVGPVPCFECERPAMMLRLAADDAYLYRCSACGAEGRRE